jgi:toxin ParE1/3/4
MADIIWTEPALQDLEAIADYIALDKPNAAAKLVQRVFAEVESLQKFPQMGSVLPEVRGLPYRQLIIPPCRVLYRIERDIVYVVHVIRGRTVAQKRNAGMTQPAQK